MKLFYYYYFCFLKPLYPLVVHTYLTKYLHQFSHQLTDTISQPLLLYCSLAPSNYAEKNGANIILLSVEFKLIARWNGLNYFKIMVVCLLAQKYVLKYYNWYDTLHGNMSFKKMEDMITCMVIYLAQQRVVDIITCMVIYLAQ